MCRHKHSIIKSDLSCFPSLVTPVLVYPSCCLPVDTGAKANKGAVVKDGKVKVQVEAHQTVGHLKAMLVTAAKGVEMPFELQKHGEEGSESYYDNDTLSDAGLVSGSVVSVPVELVDIYFVLPPGVVFTKS